MITQLKLDEARRWHRLLLAVSVSGLLLTPVANAEPAASETATKPQTLNPYAGGPGAVPPPPGPFESAPPPAVPQFRPDSELEGTAQGMPPRMPPDFSEQAGRGSLTRQQFIDQQEAHRKQLEQQFQQREAEMKKRVEDMQKRMNEMQAQSEAEHSKRRAEMPTPPPAPERMQIPEEDQKRWEQQKAEQAKRWEQQKAAQQQRMQQLRAEHDKQLEEMKAQQEQRIQSRAQYRPLTEPPAAPETPQAEAAPAPAATRPAPRPAAPAPAPAYGYGYPPRGYGYGYPPRPYGYGAPGWTYPQYPAPAAGGQQKQEVR